MPRRSLLRIAASVAIALITLACATSVFAGLASASSTTFYVAPGGADTNPGSQAAPFATLGRALRALNPGDTLLVRGGTYVENITDAGIKAATSAAPVVVKNFPGERPVLQGLLWLTNPTWWTFDGINVTWNPANGPANHMVKITNGASWTLKNGELWGAHSYAALLVAGTTAGLPANWTVSDNCIHDTYASNSTNQDHLIYANTGVSPGAGLIARNLLFNATNGEAVKLGGASETSGAGANVRVEYNTMYNNGQNVLIGWQSHDNALSHNLVGRTGGSYGNIRGYQLSGANNTASANMGFQAGKLILNDAGYPGVADTGGNQFPVDPQFDNVTSCTGFHPANAAAAGFGRYASGAGGGAPVGGGGSTPPPTPTTTTPPPKPTTTTTAPPPPPSPGPAPAPGPGPAPAPGPSSTKFADGFETGTFSQWTSASGGMTVQGGTIRSGGWAARANCTGSPSFAYKTLASPLSDVTYETGFNVLSRGTAAFSVVRLATGSGNNVIALMLDKAGRLVTLNQTTGKTAVGPAVSLNAWHVLKVRLVVNGASSSVAVSLDGAAAPSLSKADNLGTVAVGRAYIGDPATGRTFDVVYDDTLVTGPAA